MKPVLDWVGIFKDKPEKVSEVFVLKIHQEWPRGGSAKLWLLALGSRRQEILCMTSLFLKPAGSRNLPLCPGYFSCVPSPAAHWL